MLEIRVKPGELVGQESPFLRADESAFGAGGALRVVPTRPDLVVVGERELRRVARDCEGIHARLLGENQAEARENGHRINNRSAKAEHRDLFRARRQSRCDTILPF